MHQTLLVIITTASLNYWLLLFRNRSYRPTCLRNHGRSSTPLVIFATRSFRTNNLERTILPVNMTPIMINAVLIACAYFSNWWFFVPVMVATNRSVFTYDFLVDAVFHLLHKVHVFFFRFWWAKRSHTVSVSLQFLNRWIFEISFVHIGNHPTFSLCFSTSANFKVCIWPLSSWLDFKGGSRG